MVSSLSSSRPDYFHQDKEENSETAVRERENDLGSLCILLVGVREFNLCEEISM